MLSDIIAISMAKNGLKTPTAAEYPIDKSTNSSNMGIKLSKTKNQIKILGYDRLIKIGVSNKIGILIFYSIKFKYIIASFNLISILL